MATASTSTENLVTNEEKDENIKDNSDKKSPKSDSEDKKEDDDSSTRAFECNICLDTASEAVISMCGHLFCWPCLHQWLETRPQRQICPVCKAGIGRDKVVPLYGRDGDQKDPRDKPIPPRPRGKGRNLNQRAVPMVANLAICSILEVFKCLSASELSHSDFLQRISTGVKMATIKDLLQDQLSLMKNNFCIEFSFGSLLHSYFGF